MIMSSQMEVAIYHRKTIKNIRKKDTLLESKKYVDYIVEEVTRLLAIDSPSGFTGNAIDYLIKQYQKIGYEPIKTPKGSLQVKLSGKNDQNAILTEAHADTLGAMVCEIRNDGTLRVTPIGGMEANNAEAENCRIYTRSGDVFTGTCQLHNPSAHVNKEYEEQSRKFESSMDIILDEIVHTKEDVKKLGIRNGDIVCFEPRTVVTRSGFIKSRFLDDKLCVCILLAFARYIKEQKIELEHTVYQYITVYEEVGHGGAASIPENVTEILALDMGCVGDGLECKETQVSICAKDRRSPYNYEMVSKLICLAEANDIDFAVDFYPFYGSDAGAAMTAGVEARHGLIGPGIFASHGYERCHREGIKNTFELLCAYLLDRE